MTAKKQTQQVWAEYIYLDGNKTQKVRSKAQKIDNPRNSSGELVLSMIPEWGFDGSSTKQAEGHFSDCGMKPVYVLPDPLRGSEDVLVLTEVLHFDGTPHVTNTRHYLAEAMKKYGEFKPLTGIEQEYTLYTNGRPYGWPENGFPEQQGKYYCGVGFDEVYGRELVEEHREMCDKIGIGITGINAEVMPGQWEFQIGTLDPLEASDHLWIARWLLYRIGEKHGAYAKLDPKPEEGDWNGAGGHVNFSTEQMRKPGGIEVIREACKKLSLAHREHIAVYGIGNDKRLTGNHETCSITQFRFGISNRGASIRIPMNTAKKGFGYLEDRRPAANLDPYQVELALLETICGSGFNYKKYQWEADVLINDYEMLDEKSLETEKAV